MAVSWVGLDDNRPAGVTGSNAAMRVWAGLFRQLPIEPFNLDMPDGAGYLWVNKRQRALTGAGCPGAEQVPFINGSEPHRKTRCLQKKQDRDKKSLWRKWFEDKD